MLYSIIILLLLFLFALHSGSCMAPWLLCVMVFIWFFCMYGVLLNFSDKTPSSHRHPLHFLSPTLKPASWDLFYTNSDASFACPDSRCQVCQALHEWILLIFFVCSELAYMESLHYTSFDVGFKLQLLT